jgi:hypothetical protein
MNIEVHHIALEKESVLVRLLAPVIVPDPFKVLPSLTSNAQVPVVAIVAQAYVFDRIPRSLAGGQGPAESSSPRQTVIVGNFDPGSRGRHSSTAGHGPAERFHKENVRQDDVDSHAISILPAPTPC